MAHPGRAGQGVAPPERLQVLHDLVGHELVGDRQHRLVDLGAQLGAVFEMADEIGQDDELVDLLTVRAKLNVMVRELSLGERMKMELIAALLHRPRVLFLDEPTIGLDVVSQRAVRQFLRDYNRKYRVTILLTSHYMADIKELCERVIVIHKGAKIYDGALLRLESSGGARKKIITFVPGAGTAFPDTWQSQFGTTTRADDGKFTLRVPGENVVAVSQEILSTGPVADITIEDVPLEDVIAELFAAQA
mgnify:CR=1 FL=1